MMGFERQNPLDLIRRTQRCRGDIASAADELSTLSINDYEDLIRLLMEQADETGLGILLNICAVNGIQVAPELLVETLSLVEPLIDFAPPFRFQDQAVIDPLLKMAMVETLSFERQAFASMIAAEMCMVHHRSPQPVRRVVRMLQEYLASELPVQMLLVQALFLLDEMEKDEPQISPDKFLSQADALKQLPKEKPPVVIGCGQTVRRPVPKIGRNELCHCGSGKKYKKCCMEKDRELMRDASAYEGLTQTQVKAMPKLVDDALLIQDMRAHEIKRLDPVTLNVDQLYAAYHRASAFGLREKAFQLLLELECRSEEKEFDRGHFIDLLHAVLQAGDLVLAQKIRQHIPDEMENFEAGELLLFLLEHPETLDKLENQLRDEVLDADGERLDSTLCVLAYGLEKKYPVLSILFARAFITEDPYRMLDIHMLLQTIRRARTALDLEAWDDPIEEYVEWCMGEELREDRADDAYAELHRLTSELEAVREKARQNEKEVRKKEAQLQALATALPKEPKISGRDSEKNVHSLKSAPQDRSTIQRLRQRIDSLKAEIESQQQLRRELRRRLDDEKGKKIADSRQLPKESLHESSEHIQAPAMRMKTILIPEYAPAFHKAVKAASPPLAAKAIRAAAAFAAGDESILRQTRPLKALPGYYRIRIGKDQRLMMNWIPDKRLRILDLIPRGHLETWIRDAKQAV